MSIIEGICPNCGARYFGWVLKTESNPQCNECGSKLKVIENGAVIRAGMLIQQNTEINKRLEKV